MDKDSVRNGRFTHSALHRMETLKKWFASLPWAKELKEKERGEAFKLAHQDFMATMDEEIDRRAEVLSEKKVANLLSVVDWDMVISKDMKTGVLYLGTEPIETARLANLHSEANLIADMDLWKILVHTARGIAHKAMFVEGENIDAMRKGRSMLYTLDSQEKVIRLLRK